MKSIVTGVHLLFLIVASPGLRGQEKNWSVSSPANALKITLKQFAGQLFYSVTSEGDTVIRWSRLGMYANEEFADGLQFVATSSRRIDEQYTLAIGKRKINHAIANEISVRFKNKTGHEIRIELRAYPDGVAFRYSLEGLGPEITVTRELTEFAIGQGDTWIQDYDLPAQWNPSYEAAYRNGIAVGTPAKDSSGWAFPALFREGSHWLLVTEANLDGTYCGSHLAQNCDNGIYKIAFPLSEEASGIGSVYPHATSKLSTPWRVIITGKDQGTIVESNLVYHLSAKNQIGDASWVRPGRSSWSWWSDHPSSKDFKKLKKYVDLSHQMHWEYSLVDANWNIMEGGTIKDLVTYATSQKVGLTLWYNSGGPHNNITEQPRDIMSDPVRRKQEFRKLRAWGVKAVKVDFFDSDKQNIIQLYLDILKDAAKEHIMVVFHGCTLPRGWSRTYPNLVSMEGIRGAEQIGWDTVFAREAAMYNTINVFTRNVVGPMDYTPVTFSDTKCCPHTTTNAHELALSVLYESGIVHLADSDSSYRGQKEDVLRFLQMVPNTWDETKFLDGSPGKDVIIARRKGTTWYVAGINGENTPKSLSFKFPFLTAPTDASVLSDGDNSRDIKFAGARCEPGKTFNIDLLPKGGFVMVIRQPR